MVEQRSVYRYLKPEAVARMKNMTLVARSVVEGFISGLHKSPYHGFSVEFAEHREYVPGDNLRYLDWQALGRTDRYYVKQFEEETNLRCHILPDTSGSMDYKSDGVSKFEYAAYLAASLAYLMIRQQDTVGLVTYDDKIRHRILPHSTTVHLNHLLRTLESIKPGGDTSISVVFHRLAETIRKRSLLIIISDLFDNEIEVMRSLRHFRHKKHEVIIFHIFDRYEQEFPFDRLSNFIDLESGERLQIDPRYVRDEYLKQMKEFVDSYKRDCAESFIEYVATNTSIPFDFMLTNYLSKRKRLG